MYLSMVTLAWEISAHHDDSCIGQPRLLAKPSSFFLSSFFSLLSLPLSLFILFALIHFSFPIFFAFILLQRPSIQSNLQFNKYFHNHST